MAEIKDKLITAENLKNAYDDNKRQIGELKGDLVNIVQDFRSDNLININDMVKGGWIEDDGSISYYDGYNCTQFIDVSGHGGKRIYYAKDGKDGSGNTVRRLAEYDASKNFIKISKDISYVDLDSNTCYVRVGMESIINPKLTFNHDDLEYRDYYVSKIPELKSELSLMDKHFGLQIFVSNLTIEHEIGYDYAYVKFDAIDIRNNKMQTYAKTWEDIIKSDYNPNGIWTVDSQQWVKNCGFVGVNGSTRVKLIYSFIDNTIKYSTASYFDKDSLILAEIRDGVLCGALAEYNTQNIENKYYQHRYRFCNEEILQNHIITTVSNILSTMNNNDGITFGYFGDNHGRRTINGYPNLTPKYLNKVDELMNLDFILNTGDLVFSSNTASVNDAICSIVSQNMEFQNQEKLITSIGNHDQNGHTLESEQKIDWTVKHSMFFNSCYRYIEKDADVVWGSKEDLYFYKDFSDKKIRVIVLNTQDCGESTRTVDGVEYLKYDSLTTCGVRQEQLNWLANTALKFNFEDRNEWHTLIACHIGLRSGITDNHPSVQNYNAIDSIIKAFKNGTTVNATYTDSANADGLFTVNVNADYSTQGTMPFIGVFSGHNHCDRLYTENYPQITIMAGYPDNGYDGIDRSIETKNEFAFDVVSVDKVARKVTLTRFGAGSNREYTY